MYWGEQKEVCLTLFNVGQTKIKSEAVGRVGYMNIKEIVGEAKELIKVEKIIREGCQKAYRDRIP